MPTNYDLNSRILCVDPNDLHGTVNGQPLTPDYTDYCIWCNLVVETVSRLKNQAGGSDGTGTYSIQFDMSPESKHEYVSFLQGKDAEKYNYLTTDYTNIDFKSVKNRNIVEGLQVESVKISFTNFMCPSVSIKFIDLRGGGFFAREEATHNEYGNLTGLEEKNGVVRDNIFSCFTTMPYPRFKLQVKGFYGRPVTYQLTCSSFSGNFNASTGNFEINTQFVGYEYGVLGDIPFSYIVAAPLTKRGSKYWDEHVNTAAWSLSGDTVDKDGKEVGVVSSPVKLVDFYNNIEAAINEYKDKEEDINSIVNDGTFSEVLASYTNRIGALNELNILFNQLKNNIRGEFSDDNIVEASGTDIDMMVIFNTTEKAVVSKDTIIGLRNTIGKRIEEYVEKYGHFDISVDRNMIPNCDENGDWKEWKKTEIDFSEYINYSPQGDGSVGGNENFHANPNIIVSEASENGEIKRIDSEESCNGSYIVMFGDNKRCMVPGLLSKKLFESLGTSLSGDRTLSRKGWSIDGSGSYKKFAAIIDFGNAKQKITEELCNVEIEKNKFKQREGSYKSISEMLGFAPYISNYFKVVMCHLETFIHLFFDTAEVINENKDTRTPKKLGIRNLHVESDVPGSKFTWVPPFPATYKNYETEEDFNKIVKTGGNIVETSWVGDFKGETPWAEAAFVEEMAEALRVVWKENKSTDETHKETGRNAADFNASYVPIDYVTTIPEYAMSNRESMAFYAAMRAAMLFGVMDTSDFNDGDSVCEMLGALDGYNYAAKCDDGDFLKQLIGNGDGSSFPDEIEDIITCKDNGSSEHYPFEFANTDGNRQPVFKKNGNSLEYKYMKTVNGGPIFPVGNYKDFKDGGFAKSFSFSDGSFHVKNVEDTSYVFGDDGKRFVETELIQNSGDLAESAVDGYTNKCMFHIIKDEDYIKSIKESEERLANTSSIGPYKGELFENVMKRYCLSDDNFSKYLVSGDEAARLKTYSDYGIDESMFAQSKLVGKNANQSMELIKKFKNTVKY